MVLSLCQKFCADKIPVTPAHRLGDGSDGEVFEIVNQPNKVVKFCVSYELYGLDVIEHYHKDVSPILNYLVSNPVDAYARVYSHAFMGIYDRDFLSSPSGIQKFVLYNYIMEKLYKISEDESKVFHSILSHEDRKIVKDYSPDKIKKMLGGLAFGLDFDEKKVTLFCENLRVSPVNHMDIHSRNIMKDRDGNFKLIDFDRCLLGAL